MFRKKLIVAAAFLLAIVPQLALAQDAKEMEHPVKPLLWKVEGKDLKQPSWLFGTIHLGRKPVSKLHPVADKALAGSDIIYTEVPMDAANQMGIAMHLIRKDGKTLSESIGAELKKEVTAELKQINPQLTADAFDPLKTWVIATTLPLLKDQMAGHVALDSRIWTQGEKAGKQLRALEKIIDQVNIFEDFTEEEQVTMLAETLKYQRKCRAENMDAVDELLNAYVSGDPKKVEDELNAQFNEMGEGDNLELSKKMKKAALDDRNITMAASIGKHLKAEPAKVHFFAVGAGHYVGKGNICELLRKEGYTVTLHQP